MTLTIDEAVAALWPGKPAAVEALPGGITNLNYRVDVGSERFVVRMIGERTDLLGIDRRSEAAAGRLVAALGIGPEIVRAEAGEGFVVSRFIEARPLPPEEVRTQPVLAQLAAALGRVHRAGTVEASFDTFRLVPAYRKIGEEHGVEPPFDYVRMWSVLEQLAVVRPWQPAALCHNDLLNSNLLHDGGIRIVDWEYAGMGDCFFDLGNLSVNHAFGEVERRALLLAYFGEVKPAALATLRLFELASEARESMWGVVQTGISTLPIDFGAYSEEHAGGFFRLLEGMDLEESLVLAGGSVLGRP